MNIGQTLKQLRLNANVNQKDAAKKLNISPTWLSQIEKGHEKPGMKLINKCSEMYKTPLAVIMLRSIDYDDVPKEKHEVFKQLKPALINIIKSIWG